jgi:predicted RNase H-like nuclease (RuvC/YqgF family)
MYRTLIVAISICCIPYSASAEVFKCIEDGKTVFQDKPCRGAGMAIAIKPASGSAQTANDSAPYEERPETRLKEHVRSMELERKRREIEYAIRANESEIQGYQSQMERELTSLQNKKGGAKNNLAGAKWEQSISMEMQTVSAKYRTKIQVSQDRIAQLRKDAGELKKSEETTGKVPFLTQ